MSTMAVEEQTMFGDVFGTITSIFCYIVYAIKLYVIGIVALLSQLLWRSAPVRGLSSQEGRTAIVTGGASGIGLHLSRHLASLGAHVIVACRSKEEGDTAVESIQQECPEAKVQVMELDLASFSSVRTFVAEFKATGLPLHLLINNGGVMLAPFQETEDGQESHLQVNHLSHALLTSLLTDSLESSSLGKGKEARVINVSSIVHHVASLDCGSFAQKQLNDWTYSPHNAYAASKLAIVLYSYALSRRWAAKGSEVTVNAVHPGVVNTDLYRHVHWSISWAMDVLRQYLFMSPKDSALSVLHVATSPQLEGVSGCYFSLGRPAVSSSLSHTPALQETVYLTTQRVVGIKAA